MNSWKRKQYPQQVIPPVMKSQNFTGIVYCNKDIVEALRFKVARQWGVHMTLLSWRQERTVFRISAAFQTTSFTG